MAESVQFYMLDGSEWVGEEGLAEATLRSPDYGASVWRPTLSRPFPPGRYDPRILAYTGLHACRNFSNRDYAMVILRGPDGKIAHSSLIMPGFARFPFMAPRDLQIGATQTALAYRGQGLGVRAIHEAILRLGTNRRYWYLTAEKNAASVAVIRKAGFKLVGMGTKVPRYGIPFLGAYKMTSTVSA